MLEYYCFSVRRPVKTPDMEIARCQALYLSLTTIINYNRNGVEMGILIVSIEHFRITFFLFVFLFGICFRVIQYICNFCPVRRPGIRIYTGNEDYSGGCLTNPAVPSPFRVPIRSFVRMKKHSIIGANSVVLPGITIGEGSAIGANSLVTKDCEPWTIYVGSPAKAIKPRPKEKMLNLEGQLRRNLLNRKNMRQIRGHTFMLRDTIIIKSVRYRKK